MSIRDIIQLYCRDWCGGVAAPRFCGHFEMDLMVQNLSIPIASTIKTSEAIGQRGGSGLQSRHDQKRIVR
jgi:hypothetical protein